jgi:class 3 adenylate cyclase
VPHEVVMRQGRKVVTALFADLVGSTALGEALDLALADLLASQDDASSSQRLLEEAAVTARTTGMPALLGEASRLRQALAGSRS